MPLHIYVHVLILELKEAQIGLESEKIGLLEAKERCVYHFIYTHVIHILTVCTFCLL